MQKHSHFLFLENSEIDKTQWDECINTSPAGLIYARTFYLDNLCPGWSALTGENYDWVLPLTSNTKWGISYLYQPPFTQQLGVFAKENVTIPYNGITAWLIQKFPFCEVNWNFKTSAGFTHSRIKTSPAANFILNLHDDYKVIANCYHNDLIKNLKRSKQFTPVYQATKDFTKCIELYRNTYGSRMPNVRNKDYKNFRNLCSSAQQHNMLICREAVNRQNELLATALLLSDGKRLYNIMNSTTELGRKTAANHFLLDAVIREFGGQDLIFDFEGSDLPGVKSFYENFGAEDQPYFMIRYNNLQWPLRLFKK